MAFALGLPLAAALIALGSLEAFAGSVVERYLQHPIERVEIVVFCCALGALAAKFWNGRTQRRAVGMPLLPPCIGTVLGIAKSIAGVTPDVLEKSISSVTEGLALAFDTTGLGLMLTMVVMLLIYLVERREQAVLEEVDRFSDLHLAHRFERPDGAAGTFSAVVQESTRAVLRGTEQLVQRQAELWAQTLAATEERRQSAEREQQARFTAALEAALERTLASHAERLAEMSRRVEEQASAVFEPLAALGSSLAQQQTTLLPLADGMQLLAATLAQLQENEGQLLRLQNLMQQNLAGLAAAGSFEEAVHSLSAAIHLLTARAAGTPWRVVGDEPKRVA